MALQYGIFLSCSTGTRFGKYLITISWRTFFFFFGIQDYTFLLKKCSLKKVCGLGEKDAGVHDYVILKVQPR